MYLIIDGTNWFAHFYYTNLDNVSDNWHRRLNDIRNQLPHSRCVVCWDVGKSFRAEISPAYKGNRDAKPDQWHILLAKLRKQCDTVAGVDSLGVDGYEGDDLIATAVKAADNEGERSIIFSGDRDLHQLLRKGQVTQVTSLSRRNHNTFQFVTMTADQLVKAYGVRPTQWVDYRCLVGDKSDGIAGVKGIGKMTAAKLLQWKPTIEHFYKTPWHAPLTNRERTMLLAARDDLPRLRRLLTLVDSVPLPASFFGTPQLSHGGVQA